MVVDKSSHSDYVRTRPAIELYSIAGWFTVDYSPELNDHPVIFGGYFKRHAEGDIEGEVVDVFGAAAIKGKLSGSSLSFDKQYRSGKMGTKSRINYMLEQDLKKARRYKGKYEFVEGDKTGSGEVVCFLNPIDKDAYHKISGPFVAEIGSGDTKLGILKDSSGL